MTNASFAVDVSGLDGILDKLSTLPDKLQKKGATAAARSAMNVIRDSARSKALKLDDPESPNLIWKNIVTHNSPRGGRRIGGVVMRVGVVGGAQYSESFEAKSQDNPGGYTWYWRFLELGTQRILPSAFLLSALQANASAVATILADEMWEQIEKLTPKA